MSDTYRRREPPYKDKPLSHTKKALHTLESVPMLIAGDRFEEAYEYLDEAEAQIREASNSLCDAYDHADPDGYHDFCEREE